MYLAGMKTALTLLFAAALTPIFGQTFFDAGLKGAIGPTLMFNQNIFDDGKYEHVLSWGYGFGGKLGVHFGKGGHHGVTFDYLRATSKQKFDLSNRQTHEYTWVTNDLLLMYRYSGNGAYVEFGPKLSLMANVDSEYRGQPKQDVSKYFEDKYTSLVFGFGSYILGTELLSLQAGVRLHWALTDMISDEGIANEPNSYPALEASFTDYEKTTATAAQFSIELNYAFGRFAKASCSQRWRLILFE